MECLSVSKLPDGPQWVYEIKLDGYRAEAIRTTEGVAFYSRNGKSLNRRERATAVSTQNEGAQLSTQS
jgi:ATP-dependent DNA ligase